VPSIGKEAKRARKTVPHGPFDDPLKPERLAENEFAVAAGGRQPLAGARYLRPSQGFGKICLLVEGRIAPLGDCEQNIARSFLFKKPIDLEFDRLSFGSASGAKHQQAFRSREVGRHYFVDSRRVRPVFREQGG
jgi:hypothetical protein